MKRAFHITIVLGLLFVLYISVFHPIVTEKMDLDGGFIDNLFNKEETKDFNMSAFSSVSSSGNVDRFNRICSFDEEGWVWCHQNKGPEYLGFSAGCYLTSYAMLIINAGRHVGTEKNYDPVDVYLANNYGYTTNPSKRRIDAYHNVIANGFNYTFGRTYITDLSNSAKEKKVKDTLKSNPWGVIIGGKYGSDSTHYIVARLDNSGKLVFDDPAFTSAKNIENRAGAKLTSISQVYGINSWSKITTIATITPKLDENGVWQPGTWEKCLKDSNCNKCYVNRDC